MLEEASSALAPQAQAETEKQKVIMREYLKGAMREEKGAFVLPESSGHRSGEDVVGEIFGIGLDICG